MKMSSRANKHRSSASSLDTRNLLPPGFFEARRVALNVPFLLFPHFSAQASAPALAACAAAATATAAAAAAAADDSDGEVPGFTSTNGGSSLRRPPPFSQGRDCGAHALHGAAAGSGDENHSPAHASGGLALPAAASGPTPLASCLAAFTRRRLAITASATSAAAAAAAAGGAKPPAQRADLAVRRPCCLSLVRRRRHRF